MGRLQSVPPKARRYVLWAVLLLACALYIWQTAASWVDQQAEEQESVGDAAKIPPTAVSTISVKLQSAGSGSSARGLLTYDSHGTSGTLQVWNLDVLSARHVYQLWYVEGKIATSVASFSVTPETSKYDTMPVIIDHTLAASTRLMVTIEIEGGSVAPVGPVVLLND